LGFPRAQRDTILTNPVVAGVAAQHDACAAQVALGWLPAIAPNVLLIPGTRTRGHLAENLAAGGLSLSDREIALLIQNFS
jgi:diketogulonate reductase-like aldo/keto reductase